MEKGTLFGTSAESLIPYISTIEYRSRISPSELPVHFDVKASTSLRNFTSVAPIAHWACADGGKSLRQLRSHHIICSDGYTASANPHSRELSLHGKSRLFCATTDHYNNAIPTPTALSTAATSTRGTKRRTNRHPNAPACMKTSLMSTIGPTTMNAS